MLAPIFIFFSKIVCGTIQHNPSKTEHNFCFLKKKKKKKMAVLVKNSFFQNFSANFDFFQKSFAAQFSTTFVFLKKQNCGANFLDI